MSTPKSRTPPFRTERFRNLAPHWVRVGSPYPPSRSSFPGVGGDAFLEVAAADTGEPISVVRNQIAKQTGVPMST
jgi:hypothetical protein